MQSSYPHGRLWGGVKLAIRPIEVKMQNAIKIPTFYQPIGRKWAPPEEIFPLKLKQCLTSYFP